MRTPFFLTVDRQDKLCLCSGMGTVVEVFLKRILWLISAAVILAACSSGKDWRTASPGDLHSSECIIIYKHIIMFVSYAKKC